MSHANGRAAKLQGRRVGREISLRAAPRGLAGGAGGRGVVGSCTAAGAVVHRGA